jgi:hypothetical protein
MNATKKNRNSKPFPWLLVAIGLLVLGAAAAAGWNWYQKRYPSWYEEVRLSDGRVITIHQKREYFDNYGTAQSWVTIDLPELGGKQVWHSYLMPQRVDVVDGKVYVFGAPRGIKENQVYNYPKQYMVAFKWSKDGFERVAFLSLPALIRSSENVYSCIPQPLEERLRLETKDQRWCPVTGGRWKFGKDIVLSDYEALANFYAKADGGKPISD